MSAVHMARPAAAATPTLPPGAAGVGTPPELAWLPVDKLDVDARYQRSLEAKASQKLIDKIAQEFDWMKFQALLCARKPDDPERYLLIDGQHRTQAAKKRGGIPHLPSLVFAEASLADQAKAFVGANKDRVTVSAQTLFHARLLAGDPMAVRLKTICAGAGIELLRYPMAQKQLPAGKTAAIPLLLQIVRDFTKPGVPEDAIGAVGERWRGQAGILVGPVFLAAARFLHRGLGDRRGLDDRLRRLDTRRVERAIATPGGSSNKADAVLALILGNLGERPASQPNAPGAFARKRAEAEPAPKPSISGAGMDMAAAPSQPGPERSRSIAGNAPAQPATPVKAGPLAAALIKPPDPDRAAIDKFLAEKGARQVMSPEQVAAFLRDSGHECTIRESAQGGGNSKTPVKWVRQAILDGKPVHILHLYQRVNVYRAKIGLGPVSHPAPEKAA